METCYRHPSRETGVSCSNCERPICTDCMTPTPVGMRCPECSRERTQVRTAQSLHADPTLTHVLIAINLLAFVGSAVAGGGLARGAGGEVLANGGLFGPAVAAGEYWRLVTSGFLHSGLIHIAFNAVLLYLLGGMLEPALGRARFAALYFTALLAGSFGALLLSPYALTVGASGAVFGLMGAAVVEMRRRGIDPMQSPIAILLVINLLITFVRPGISIGGHLGGLAGGLAAAYLIEMGIRRRSLALSVGACAALSVVVVAGALLAAGRGGGALF
jgi:membrane associated rhomboid family serine protease